MVTLIVLNQKLIASVLKRFEVFIIIVMGFYVGETGIKITPAHFCSNHYLEVVYQLHFTILSFTSTWYWISFHLNNLKVHFAFERTNNPCCFVFVEYMRFGYMTFDSDLFAREISPGHPSTYLH